MFLLQFLESSANMFAAAQQLSQNSNPGEVFFFVVVLVAMAAECSPQSGSNILPERFLAPRHHLQWGFGFCFVKKNV